ncbi:hypothetical protein C8R46DRAFT_1044828 [Mycena filopes]|nr:hypothetical protein C8R46DRAFT_1044828 [Mycena filopes]
MTPNTSSYRHEEGTVREIPPTIAKHGTLWTERVEIRLNLRGSYSSKDRTYHRMQVLYLSDRLPLITPRMQFHPLPGRLPYITPRLSYNSLQQIVAFRDNQNRNMIDHLTLTACPRPPVAVVKKENNQEPPPLTSEPIMRYKYRKPHGQPGRPNSGGYNLENVLLEQCNWSREVFQRIQKRVQHLAERRLITNQSFQAQDTKSVKKVSTEYGLSDYEDFWPITAMLKLYLKARSEAYRKDNLLSRRRPRRQRSTDLGQSSDDCT